MDLFPETQASLPATQDDDQGFAIFWEAYPRKVAKAAALRAWKKLRLTRPQAESLARHVSERRRRDRQWLQGAQYIPHPSTFLNGRRWEDEWQRAPEGVRPDADRRTTAVQRAYAAVRFANSRST